MEKEANKPIKKSWWLQIVDGAAICMLSLFVISWFYFAVFRELLSIESSLLITFLVFLAPIILKFKYTFVTVLCGLLLPMMFFIADFDRDGLRTIYEFFPNPYVREHLDVDLGFSTNPFVTDTNHDFISDLSARQHYGLWRLRQESGENLRVTGVIPGICELYGHPEKNDCEDFLQTLKERCIDSTDKNNVDYRELRAVGTIGGTVVVCHDLNPNLDALDRDRKFYLDIMRAY